MKKASIYKVFFQEYYQSLKQFGSRSNLTCCKAWYETKLFEKIISKRQKSSLVGKKLNYTPFTNFSMK